MSVITLKIYSQCGKLISLPVADNNSNSRLKTWLQKHDRYSASTKEQGE